MTISYGRHIVIGLVLAVLMAAVVGGFLLLGSPTEERLHRLDNRRVNDLKCISHAVDAYWTQYKHLPVALDDLSQQPGPNLIFRDPTTGQLYEYHTLGDSTYELCATFQRESAQESPGQNRDFWSHGAGRQCFQLEARGARNNRENVTL